MFSAVASSLVPCQQFKALNLRPTRLPMGRP